MAYKKRRSPAKAKESRADKEASKIEEDMLAFWGSLAESKMKSWDRPWIFHMMLAENAGKYLTTDERYVYKGGFNQILIASYAREKESDLSHLIINRGEMNKLFDAEKFADTPVVKEGIKSLGSIYVYMGPKQVWVTPDGTPWKDGSKKFPSKDDVKEQSLKKVSVGGAHYTTAPVWSVADIQHLFSEEQNQKLASLRELRKPKGYAFDSKDPGEVIIDAELDDVLKRQGIEVKLGGNEAAYYPTLDHITLPDKGQFSNPVARYAVTMHELAHSTKHINGRNPVSRDGLQYAREEVVAETTAVMMVKQLEMKLQDIMPERPDLRTMFANYYDNAITYSKGGGSKIKFEDMVAEATADEKGNPIRKLVSDVSKATYSLLSESYSPEQRQEFLKKNMKDASLEEKPKAPDRQKELSNEGMSP